MSMQSPLQVTSPQSFSSSPPLTPPPTDEKASQLITGIIAEIRRRKDGRSPSTEPWTRYTLDENQYKDLLHRVQSNESLWAFLQHKLRYENESVRATTM
jgi:hypothetical protein